MATGGTGSEQQANQPSPVTVSTALLSGALAGAVSVVAFTIVHGMMISDIWFMIVPMLIAGGICGSSLSASYALVVGRLTAQNWLLYNLLFLLLLFLLGPVSLMVFEPVITIPELLASPNGLPAELTKQVLPLAAVYTAAMSLVVTAIYGRRWSALPIVFATCAILVLLLGLNIGAMGLVYLTGGWAFMLLEMLGLILSLNLVYLLVTFGLLRFWGRFDSAVGGRPSKAGAS